MTRASWHSHFERGQTPTHKHNQGASKKQEALGVFISRSTFFQLHQQNTVGVHSLLRLKQNRSTPLGLTKKPFINIWFGFMPVLLVQSWFIWFKRLVFQQEKQTGGKKTEEHHWVNWLVFPKKNGGNTEKLWFWDFIPGSNQKTEARHQLRVP